MPSFTAPSLTGPDIVDIKPANMEDLTEVITASEFHPHHCNLFVYSSSKGSLRLCDMRAAALCDKHSKRKCPRLGLTPRSAGGADPKGRRNCQGSAWGGAGSPCRGAGEKGWGAPGRGGTWAPSCVFFEVGAGRVRQVACGPTGTPGFAQVQLRVRLTWNKTGGERRPGLSSWVQP